MRYKIQLGLFSLSLIAYGILAFFNPAKAETVWIDNFNAVSNQCWYADQEATCTPNVGDPNREVEVWQEIEPNCVPSSGGCNDPDVPISAISMWVEQGWVDGDDWTAYIFNSQEMSDYIATGNVTTYRKAKTMYVEGAGEKKFVFDTVYHSTSTDHIGGILFKQSGCVGTCGYSLALTADNYPDTFPFVYRGGYKNRWSGSSRGYFSDYKDLQFRIYRDDTQFTITNPERYENISGVFDITGTCQTNVGLYIKPLATSTPIFYRQPACSGNAWTTRFTGLTSGAWYIYATSTEAIRSVAFNYSSATDDLLLQTPLLNWSCEITYLNSWNPCASFSNFINDWVSAVGLTIQDWSSKVSDVRPFSYVPEIYNSVQTVINATTTNTLLPNVGVTIATSTSPYFGTTISLFTPDVLLQILDQETWDTFRPYAISVLYILFVMYLWKRIIRLIS